MRWRLTGAIYAPLARGHHGNIFVARPRQAPCSTLRRVDEGIYPQLFALEDGHWWFRGRRAVIWALLSGVPVPRPARILDASCGTGRNLVEYGSLGEAQGVDPSEQAVAFCHERGLDNVGQAGLESLPFADCTFDLELALDVIEHIDRDDQALTELRRVAAPDGRLVITVPAYNWLWSSHDDVHHHFRRYTRPRLTKLVERNGWRVERATYFNSVLLLPIAAARAISARSRTNSTRSDYAKTPRALNRALAMPMKAEAFAIERGTNLPAGVSIGMVCARL